jgi:hypothetical protein
MFAARLYLDFDGVLNAKKPQFNDVEQFDLNTNGLRTKVLKKTTVTFSPTVVNTLESFRELYNVELVWLSTWNENLDVLRLPKPLRGLTGGRVLPSLLNLYADTDRQWTQWKADALLADQKNDELPFVWVDDQAIKFHGKTVAASTVGTPSLMVAPREYWGLHRAQLDSLDSFFSSL